MFVNVE